MAAARERAEREMIVATLARHNGEISSAARELQVSRTTMWRLMKKHGISGLTAPTPEPDPALFHGWNDPPVPRPANPQRPGAAPHRALFPAIRTRLTRAQTA